MWDPRSQTLHWVDMLAGDVLSLDEAGGPHRRHVGTVAAALRPRAAGGMVVAVERGFVILDDAWAEIATVPATADPRVRMNDGSCDPQGRFYCGTMAYEATDGAGVLYCLDRDRAVRPVLPGVTVSNGLGWSRDGTTAYYVDSARQSIDAFDFDGATGQFSRRRQLVTVDPVTGTPDGLTVDAGGCIWVALWDGAAVHCYSPAGELLSVLRLPTPRVTSCVFGGPGLADLYVTTSRLGVDGDDRAAGSVFRFRPGATGMPPLTYAG
jgi:sugar lactone lactonase YvrE